MPHHRHHHRRHDVYDDTSHNQLFDPANEVTVHRRQSDHSRHRRGDHHDRHDSHDSHDSHALIADPLHDMDSIFRAAEREMGGLFGGLGRFGGGFADGMFGSMQNMMTSMDRMFDQAASAGPSGGTYYYESRKMTVGPDGRVHEETVRTVPDARGNPQTSRTVRDGDRVEETGPYSGRIRGGASSRYNDDVVIEEVDENGDPIREDRVARRRSRDDGMSRRRSRDERERRREGREQPSGNWLRNKYREWRSGA